MSQQRASYLADRPLLLTAVKSFILENPWAHLVIARMYIDKPDIEVMAVPESLQLTALGHTGWDILSQTLNSDATPIARGDTRIALLWNVHGGKALRWWPA